MKVKHYVIIGVVLIALAVGLVLVNKEQPNGELGETRWSNIFTIDDAGALITASQVTGQPMDNVTTVTDATSTLGNLDADTYYYVITSVDKDGGETMPTDEDSCASTVTNFNCDISLTVDDDAESTRIWFSDTSGTYTKYWTLSATSTTNISTSTGATYFTTATLPTTISTAFNDLQTPRYDYKYSAAATANIVVKASAGTLHSIILGKWVTGGTVECSDHASDGDGNVQVFLTSGATDESGFPKTVPVDAYFSTGITCDTIGSTFVTFIYE